MAIQQNFPEEGPTLNLDFANTKRLDPRITFARTSAGTCLDHNGLIRVLPANEPRFNHNYNSTTGQLESLGLLVEEQRTNSTTHSEDYSNNSFFSDLVITTNTIVAPDGNTTADTLTSSINGGANTCFVDKNFLISSNTSYAYSVFLKAGTSPVSTINMYFTGGTFRQAVLTITWGQAPVTSFTTTSGTTGSFNLVSYPNGWHRATIVFNSGDNTAGGVSRVYVRDQGNSNVSGHTVNVWGHQVEQGSFPTSYIPTSASTVTRTVDMATVTGTNFSNWYNPEATKGGTILAQARRGYTGNFIGYPNLYAITDGTGANSIKTFGAEPSPQLTTGINTASISQLDYVFANITTNDLFKTAHSFAPNDSTYCVNKNLTTTDTSVTIPVVSRLNIGSTDTLGSNPWNGTISSISYYPNRLLNTQLQALTA